MGIKFGCSRTSLPPAHIHFESVQMAANLDWHIVLTVAANAGKGPGHAPVLSCLLKVLGRVYILVRIRARDLWRRLYCRPRRLLRGLLRSQMYFYRDIARDGLGSLQSAGLVDGYLDFLLPHGLLDAQALATSLHLI